MNLRMIEKERFKYKRLRLKKKKKAVVGVVEVVPVVDA